MAKHKAEIVLRALLNGVDVEMGGDNYAYLPKDTELGLDACIGIRVAALPDGTEPMYSPIDIPLAVFVEKCENMPDSVVAIISANLALRNEVKDRKGPKPA